MKGVAALLIVFSHAHYYVQDLGVLKIFKPFGYIGVSLFFFCSGYGVMKKYITDSNYLNGFLAKRFKGVYIPYMIATVLWFLVNAIVYRNNYDGNAVFSVIVNSVFLIKTSLPFAWYVLAVLIWYLVFFMIARLFKDSKKILFCLFVLNVMWYFIGINLEIASFYYNGTCCLIIGSAIAEVENKINIPERLIMSTSVMAFGISILALYFFGAKSSILYTIVIAFSSTAFVICLFTVGYKFEFYSATTRMLGNYSYEIYLTQGISYLFAKEIHTRFDWLFWCVFALSMIGFISMERMAKNKICRLGV